MGTVRIERGALTSRVVTAVALDLVRLVDPILVLLELLDELQATAAALARIVGLVVLAPRQIEVAVPVSPRRAAVRITGLRFGYGDDEVLHGIDLEPTPGRWRAYCDVRWPVGPSWPSLTA